MPSSVTWVYVAVIPAFLALFLSGHFFRRYTRNKELKTLLWAQLCALPSALLFVRLLETAGMVSVRVADYLYLTMVVLIFAVGIFLRGSVRSQQIKKPAVRNVAKRPTGAQKGAAGTNKAVAAGRKNKSKKRKGR